jgi:hypothetical protein
MLDSVSLFHTPKLESHIVPNVYIELNITVRGYEYLNEQIWGMKNKIMTSKQQSVCLCATKYFK